MCRGTPWLLASAGAPLARRKVAPGPGPSLALLRVLCTPTERAAGLPLPQGPLLEAEGKQIGVVSAIAAPAALRIHFSGAPPAQLWT